MRCVQVENGIVTNAALWGECPTGWIESSAGISWTYADGEFTAPTVEAVELTTQQKIDALESTQISARRYRERDLYIKDPTTYVDYKESYDYVNETLESIDSQIIALRAELD